MISKSKILKRLARTLGFVACFLVILYFAEDYARHRFFLSIKYVKIKELQERGIEAFPAFTPYVLIQDASIDQWDPLPLGGVANANTVFCREDGDMITYTSDRFGFRNDDKLWDSQGVDLLLVGDSFVQGACVPEEATLAARLRQEGLETLSLGSYGNGPLSSLAMLKEYAALARPQKIYWFYFANDLLELESESKTQLTRYLDPTYSAGTAAKARAQDKRLVEYLMEQQRILENRHIPMPPWWYPSILANRFAVLQQSLFRPPPAEDYLETDYEAGYQNSKSLDNFLLVLHEAQNFSRNLNIDFVFVYLPDARMFGTGKAAKKANKLRERLIQAVSSQGIPVIDIEQSFRHVENPFKEYAALGAQYGHFNELGYQRVASVLASAVTQSVVRN